jgi:hypothetical protein
MDISVIREFATNLANKVRYAVYDPKAEEFAKKQEIQKKEKENENEKNKDQNDKQKIKNTTESLQTENINDSIIEGQDIDSDEFSFKRVFKSFWFYFKHFITIGIGIAIVLLMASIVSNGLIMSNYVIRILGFAFVLLITYFLPIVVYIFFIFFAGNALYSYIYNTVLRDKSLNPRRYMPYIYALLPISTRQYDSTFMKLIMYPFTYPKTELSHKYLLSEINNYEVALKQAVNGFDNYMKGPGVASNVAEVHNMLIKMHEIIKPQQKVQEIPIAKLVQPPTK